MKRACFAVLLALMTVGFEGESSGQTIVSGVIGPTGTIVSGTGFTVKFIPAGSGATLYGTVIFVPSSPNEVSCADSMCDGNFGSLTVGEWIEVSKVFYQIASLNATSLVITLTYNFQSTGGTYSMFSGNMSIWNAYAITFTTPFPNTPAVTMSIRGDTSKGNGKNAGQSPATIQIDSSGANGGLANTGFQVYEERTGSQPTLPGTLYEWTFVASGG